MNKDYEDLYNFADSVLSIADVYFDELYAFKARLEEFVSSAEADRIISKIDQNDITLEEIMDIVYRRKNS